MNKLDKALADFFRDDTEIKSESNPNIRNKSDQTNDGIRTGVIGDENSAASWTAWFERLPLVADADFDKAAYRAHMKRAGVNLKKAGQEVRRQSKSSRGSTGR